MRGNVNSARPVNTQKSVKATGNAQLDEKLLGQRSSQCCGFIIRDPTAHRKSQSIAGHSGMSCNPSEQEAEAGGSF